VVRQGDWEDEHATGNGCKGKCEQYLSNRTRWLKKKIVFFFLQVPLAKKTALWKSLWARVNDQDVLEVENRS
jgi:hypothetical protein